MSKNKYSGKKLPPDEVLKPLREGVEEIAKADGLEVDEESFEAAKSVLSADKDGIVPGQVYEGVKVPDRPINVMGLTPGAVLGPLVIEAPYTQTNDGWWIAFFEGEGCTGIKLYVDAEMLKSGKLRK